jgi:hypothetical protein
MRQLSPVKYLVLPLALLGVLLVPATASAVEYKLKGTVKGDANGVVSMKVVVKKGQLQKIRAFTYSKLDGFCDQDESVGYETPAGERSGAFGGSTTIRFGGAFMDVRYGANPQRVGIFGTVKQKGKKVTGTVEVYFDRFCKAGGNFVAT